MNRFTRSSFLSICASVSSDNMALYKCCYYYYYYYYPSISLCTL